MAWYVSLYSWPLRVGGVGLFVMRPWFKRVMILFSFDCLDCWYGEVGSMNVDRGDATQSTLTARAKEIRGVEEG